MSRIGKKPVPIPAGVEVKVGADAVQIKGPKGSLSTPVHPSVTYVVEGSESSTGRDPISPRSCPPTPSATRKSRDAASQASSL